MNDSAKGYDMNDGRAPVSRHYHSPVKESQGEFYCKSNQRTVPCLALTIPGEEDELDAVSRKRPRDDSVVIAKAVLTPAIRNFSSDIKVQLAEERCCTLHKAVESLRKQVEELKKENKELREMGQSVSAENDEDCQSISVQAHSFVPVNQTGSALSTAQERGASPLSSSESTDVGENAVEDSTSKAIDNADVDEQGIRLGWIMSEADLKFEDLVSYCPSLKVIVDLPNMEQTVKALNTYTREGTASKKAKVCV